VETGVAAVIVPIFPLPEVTFFPGTLLPLHVFEARYRAMVQDALDTQRRIAVVQLKPGYDANYAGKPPVHAIAGMGEIIGAERLATCRYNIVLRGRCRIRIEGEMPSDTLYRIVAAERLEEDAPSGDVTRALERIRAGCRRLLKALDRPPDLLDATLEPSQSPGIIADKVAAAVLPGAALRQELLEMLDVARRLERVGTALDALIRELTGGRE
jgi:Lon protease-like protein